MIVLAVVRTVAAWLVMMFVGTNLIGLVVRFACIARAMSMLQTGSSTPDVVARPMNRSRVASTAMTVVLAIVIGVYFYILVHFWNALLAAAGLMVMASRLPDLLWEIRTGSKVGLRIKPRGPAYTLATVVNWTALPLIWFALRPWHFPMMPATKAVGGVILVVSVLGFGRALQATVPTHARVFRWGVVAPLTGLILLIWGSPWLLGIGLVVFLLAGRLSTLLVTFYPATMGALIGCSMAHTPGNVPLLRVLVGTVLGAVTGFIYAVVVMLAAKAYYEKRDGVRY